MNSLQLKKLRRKLRLTQDEAARKLGVSQSYFSLLEKGKRPLSDNLVNKAVSVFQLPPTALPVQTGSKSLRPMTNEKLVRELAALDYLGYSHIKASAPRNPVDVLAAALCADDLEGRLVEALPWVLLKFSDMQWNKLVIAAKLRDKQNRLGFLTSIARKLAEKAGDAKNAAKFMRRENELERSRLANPDTLCRESMTETEKDWVRQTRSKEAAHWNILSNLSADYLSYDK